MRSPLYSADFEECVRRRLFEQDARARPAGRGAASRICMLPYASQSAQVLTPQR